MKKAKPLAFCAVMLALAMILSYIESLIPLPVLLPGVKLGLANTAVLFVMLYLSPEYAAVISLLRVLLSALLFGNITGFILSLCGAALSFAVMLLLAKCRIFSAIGISIGGAAAHSTAQVLVASLLMGNASVIYYLSFLLLCSTVTGAIGGTVVLLLQKRLGSGLLSARKQAALEEQQQKSR